MEKSQLIQYLKDAIALETDILTQNKIFDEANQTALNRQPKLDKKIEPQPPERPYSLYFGFTLKNKMTKHGAEESRPLCVGIGIILFIILCCILSYWDLETSAITILIFLFTAIPLTIPFIKEMIKKKKDQNKYNLSKESYKKQIESIRQKNKALEEKYLEETDAWRQSSAEMSAYLSKPLAQTKELLDKLYAKDVIYPKYRTLPALTSIYEYFVTGRCDSLAGANGAYNMYEDEVRKDTVISQLNTVIENLEQIRLNR